MRPIVLASSSPRRKLLLAQLVEVFEVLPTDVDEDALTTLDPRETAGKLAEAKAQAGLRLRPDALVIGSDTVVALGQTQLAKPADGADARRMLRALSGHTHQVLTGVCLASADGSETFVETTDVTFRCLDDHEIEDYVQTGEPMDKAGAYAIQGGAKNFILETNGSISNVIGLPLEALKDALERYASGR